MRLELPGILLYATDAVDWRGDWKSNVLPNERRGPRAEGSGHDRAVLNVRGPATAMFAAKHPTSRRETRGKWIVHRRLIAALGTGERNGVAARDDRALC